MCTLTNTEVPDERLHNVAFHHGLIFSLRQNVFREINIIFVLKL